MKAKPKQMDFGCIRRSKSLASDVRYCFGMAEDMCGALHPDEMDDVRRMVRAIRRDVLALIKKRGR